MSSQYFVSLEAKIAELKQCFIIERDDISEYTANDHRMALAFVLMASANLESYVEDHCAYTAKVAFERLKKSQPTTAGRALVMWQIISNSSGPHPFDPTDVQLYRDRFKDMLKSYLALVEKSHGIDGRDLKLLGYPLGLQPSDIPEELLDRMQVFSKTRNPASHAFVNRAKTMTEPKVESDQVEKILELLKTFDGALQRVAST